MLAHLLRADLLPESYIAPIHVRQERQKLRYRLSLVKMRTALKNRIHSLLEQLGVATPPVTDLFGKEGLAWLKTIQLDDAYLKSLEGYLKLIGELDMLIREMDNEIRGSLKDNPLASLLDTIPGIGILTAHLLLAEIGPIDRFPSAKKLCSYAGLVPSVHQSGQTSYNGRITKQGSRYIRWAMIEAAQKAYVKDVSLSRFYHKLCGKKGRSKAMVALARKMLVIVYNVLRYNEPYNLSGKPVERAGQRCS
jgi:transposase